MSTRNRTLAARSLKKCKKQAVRGPRRRELRFEPLEDRRLLAVNPVGFWQLQLNGNDASGNGNTATLVNSPSYVNGKVGSAISLNGSNQQLTVADNASFDYTNGITIAAWINLDTTPGTAGGIWSDIDSGSTANGVRAVVLSDRTVQFRIANGSTNHTLTSSTTLSTGAWHHVACTFDGTTSTAGTMRIYIDGVQELATATTNNFGVTGNSVTKYIGNTIGQSYYLDGSLDELRVCNQALLSSQVRELALNPISNWPLDGNGNDSSGNGNTATAVGSPSYVTGKVGNAVSLNGSSQSLTVADNASFAYTNGVTMSTWIKIAALPGGTGGIWSDIDASAGYRKGVSVALASNGKIYFIIADNSGYSQLDSNTTTLSADGNWHQITCTYDNATMRIYIDGAQANSTASSRTITDNTSTKYIGDLLFSGGHNYFNGAIDNLRVYNQALSGWDSSALIFDNTMPQVNITSPALGETLDGVVTITATAADPSGIYAVNFYLDNYTFLGTDFTAPYTYDWDTALYSDGPHTLIARALDNRAEGPNYGINAQLQPGYASYLRPTGGEMITSLGTNLIAHDDASYSYDDIKSRDAVYYSVDNGVSWSATRANPDYDSTPLSQDYRRDKLPLYVDPVNGHVVQFVNSADVAADPGEDPLLEENYYLRYRVSTDGGASYLFDSPVVQSGMTQSNPFSGINIGENAFYIGDAGSGVAFRTSSGRIIVPTQSTVQDGAGGLLAPGAGPVYKTSLLIGTWQSDHTITWSTAKFLTGNYSLTKRGLLEPTITQLSNGNLLCVMRGSNGGSEDAGYSLSSYKWYSISTDDGDTWTTPAQWEYSDTTDFYSPSSCSRLLTTSSGDTYWIGNISPTNAAGNTPRYPLVIGKVDPTTRKLIKSTVLTIDTLQVNDSAGVNLSHMWVFEDRVTNDIVITGNRNSGDYSISSPVRYTVDVSGASPVLANSPFVTVSNPIRSAGFVGDWSFDNNASDSSGYGNSGTTVGSPSYVTGKVGNAISVNGSSQSVTVADDASFAYTNGVTVSAWIKIAALPGGTGGIWSDIDASAGYRKGVSVALASNGKIYFIIADNSGYSQLDSNTTTLSADGNWHRIMCTYNNASMEIYIDGTLANSTASSRTITDNTSTKYIGDLLYFGSHNYFNGAIDDLHVYTGVGPLGHWQLDEGTGTQANDASGYGNTATTVGSPSWVTGKVETAVALNGSSQSLTIADNASFAYTYGVTVSAWIKIAALPGGTAGIWSDIDASAGYRKGVSVALGWDGKIYFIIADNSGYSQLDSNTTTLSADGKWHQIMCTYNNASMKIYIDGALATSTAASRTITDNTSTKYIGDLLYAGGHNYFNGAIDDLIVYDDPPTTMLDSFSAADSRFQHRLALDALSAAVALVKDKRSAWLQGYLQTFDEFEFGTARSLINLAVESRIQNRKMINASSVLSNQFEIESLASDRYKYLLSAHTFSSREKAKRDTLDAEAEALANGHDHFGHQLTDAIFDIYGEQDGNQKADGIGVGRFRAKVLGGSSR